MPRRFPLFSLIAILWAVFSAPTLAPAQSGVHMPANGPAISALRPEPVDTASVESFEKRVRPVLVQYCYECHSHNANKSLGNLFLDSRAAILQGEIHVPRIPHLAVRDLPLEPDLAELVLDQGADGRRQLADGVDPAFDPGRTDRAGG